MAKITKKDLKNIVKECLVEILAEGLGEKSILEAKKPRTSETSLSRSSSASRIDESVINVVTQDPIMQEIFKDTAQTTLVEQSQHSTPVDSRYSESIQDMLDNAGSHWADLAFPT